jgi:hypothetical protein
MPKSRTRCECKEAVAKRFGEEAEKEIERRKTVPRIALTDYKEPMVWCDGCDEFVQVDDLGDHRAGCFDDNEDRAARVDTTYFACYPTGPLTTPVAADIIEALQETATAEANPEDEGEVLDFSQGAEEVLDGYLKDWAEKYVEARAMWYADMNLIVEVDHGRERDAVSDVPAADPVGD